MEAKDFRRGNKVRFAAEGIDFTVLEISRNGLTVENKTETTWIDIDQFEGIPLTEDILVKAGFEFKPTGKEVYEQTWINSNGFEIWQHDKGFCHDYFCGGNVNYLHQLQNLYFALTGQELTIEL